MQATPGRSKRHCLYSPHWNISYWSSLLASELEQYDSAGTSLGSKRYMAYAGHAGYALEFGSIRIGTTLTGFQEYISGTKWQINVSFQLSPIPILAMGVTVHTWLVLCRECRC